MSYEDYIQHMKTTETTLYNNMLAACPTENKEDLRKYYEVNMKKYDDEVIGHQMYDEYLAHVSNLNTESSRRHQSDFDKIENLQGFGYRRFLLRR